MQVATALQHVFGRSAERVRAKIELAALADWTTLRESDSARKAVFLTSRALDTTTFPYKNFNMSSAALALDVRPVSRLFKALGDETRLRIIGLLSHGELCVCHLEKALRLSQPNVSRHLSVLRAARVVEPRRDGTWVYYRLVPQEASESDVQLKALIESFAQNPGLRRDVKALVKACGPNACK